MVLNEQGPYHDSTQVEDAISGYYVIAFLSAIIVFTCELPFMHHVMLVHVHFLVPWKDFMYVCRFICTLQSESVVFLQLQSYLGAMLKGVVLSKRLASPECVRLFLTLPSFILQPLHPSLYAIFASALTTLPAEWKTLLGQHRT